MRITRFKNRYPDLSRPVEVYRCLNRKGKVFSIRQDGLVVGHSDNITLQDCEYVVNQAGKTRCITEQSRNVHAFVRGNLYAGPIDGEACEFYYNPYNDKGFVVDILWERELIRSKFASLGENGTVAYGVICKEPKLKVSYLK